MPPFIVLDVEHNFQCDAYMIRREHRRALLLCVVVFLVYTPTVFLDFALDDIFLIEKNPYLKEDPWALLWGDLWLGDESVSQSSFFRPLFVLSILVDTWLGGSPWIFHIHNVIWHVCSCGMLYLLLRRWLTEDQALVGLGIFALHPLQSETVVWISARNDSMAAFFVFASLWLYTKSDVSPLERGGRFLTVCFALLSKESAILLPILVFVSASKDKKRLLIESAIAVCSVMLLRAYLGLGVNTAEESHVQLFLGSLDVLVVGDASRFLFPWPLCATRPLAWDVLSGVEILGGISFVLYSLWLMKIPRAGIALFAAFLVWIPTLLPTMLNGMHGDRYVYLPLAGVSFAIACAVSWRTWMWIVPIFWILVIQQRIPNWSDDDALWSSMYTQKPSSFSAVSYAHILYNQKEYQKAAVLYQEGYAEPVPYLAGCGPYLVSIIKVLGPGAVLEAGEWSLERGCALSGTMGGVLALGLASEQRWEDAEQVIRISPVDPTKRMLVIEGVLALQKGLWSRFLEIREGWSDRNNFDQQIALLLQEEEIKIQYLPIKIE